MKILTMFSEMFNKMSVEDSRPDLVEELHEGIIDHECDGNIKNHSAHPRHGSFVECSWSLIGHDLPAKIRILKLSGTST